MDVTGNSNGFITKVYDTECITTISYDGLHIKSIKSTWLKWDEVDTTSFTWSSGNLTKIESENVYSDGDSYKSVMTIKYDNKNNKYHQWSPFLAHEWHFHFADYYCATFLQFSGILGIGSSNFPTSITIKGYDDGNLFEEGFGTFRYVLNDNNTILREDVEGFDEDGEGTYSYTLSYNESSRAIDDEVTSNNNAEIREGAHARGFRARMLAKRQSKRSAR